MPASFKKGDNSMTEEIFDPDSGEAAIGCVSSIGVGERILNMFYYITMWEKDIHIFLLSF
ncbi:hypothetical protein Bca4012_083444 [Brassica carinata]